MYFRILWGGRLQSGGFRIGVPKIPSETRKGKKCWTHVGALAGCEALPKFLFFPIVRMDRLVKRRLESRAAFLVRLRRCVTWINEHKADHSRKMCTNQKERANDVLQWDGAKTKT